MRGSPAPIFTLKIFSELHQVWPITAAESEPGSKISLELITQSAQQRGIHSLLVGHIVSRKLSLLLLLCKETLLIALCALLLLGSAEISIIELGNVHGRCIYLGGGGNNISLVDATEGNSVQLERSGNQEETRRELSEEHYTLSLETTSKENENSAGGDGRAQLCGVADNATVNGLRRILGVVILRFLGGSSSCRLLGLGVNGKLATVLLLDGPKSTAKNKEVEIIISIQMLLPFEVFAKLNPKLCCSL